MSIRERCRTLYKQGVPCAQIATHVGYPVWQVRAWLEYDLGIQLPRHVSKAAQARALHAQGRTAAELAAQFGVATFTMREWLRRSDRKEPVRRKRSLTLLELELRQGAKRALMRLHGAPDTPENRRLARAACMTLDLPIPEAFAAPTPPAPDSPSQEPTSADKDAQAERLAYPSAQAERLAYLLRGRATLTDL
jgi:hypothetical protein